MTTETIGIIYQWVNIPLAVAMLFGFAGAVFLAIYLLRRIRK